MKIALVGYGKMGLAIENLGVAAGHSISYKIGKSNQHQIADLSLENTDIVIEFSSPENAVKNIKTCIQKGIPVVSGTTGWLNDWEEITDYCKQHNGTFFYASNYSIGVNLFFKINEFAAKLMAHQNYKVELEEIHHLEKKDSPSGTAITLAQPILNERHLNGWVNKATNNKEKLGIISKREANVAGTHSITYSSEIDEISYSHVAHGRKGFAKGALAVAEWIIKSKSTGVLSMKNFLQF